MYATVKLLTNFKHFQGGQCFSIDLKTQKLILITHKNFKEIRVAIASAEGLSNQSSTLRIQHIVLHLAYFKIKIFFLIDYHRQI